MEQFAAYTDHDLLMLVSEGDQNAFRCLFDKYRGKVFAIAWKIIGTQAAAEDVVQEVFLKLWLKKESLCGIENFNAYLNIYVKNHIFNCLRKVACEEVLLQKLKEKPAQQVADGFESACYHDLENLLQKAIDILPPQQKRIYYFNRVNGLKPEEIAEIMGISRSTVKGHITQALSRIKSMLASKIELLIFPVIISIGTFVKNVDIFLN